MGMEEEAGLGESGCLGEGRVLRVADDVDLLDDDDDDDERLMDPHLTQVDAQSWKSGKSSEEGP